MHDDKKIIRIDPRIHRDLKAEAARRGITITALAEDAILSLLIKIAADEGKAFVSLSREA